MHKISWRRKHPISFLLMLLLLFCCLHWMHSFYFHFLGSWMLQIVWLPDILAVIISQFWVSLITWNATWILFFLRVLSPQLFPSFFFANLVPPLLCRSISQSVHWPISFPIHTVTKFGIRYTVWYYPWAKIQKSETLNYFIFCNMEFLFGFSQCI